MNKTAVICGGSQGIGLAIVKNLLLNNSFSLVLAPYRLETDLERLFQLKKSFPNKLILIELDPTSEESLEYLIKKFSSLSKSVDLLINCIGFLYNDKSMPEKSIGDIRTEALLDSFKVNTLPSLLLAKHFKPLLQQAENSTFVALSAKVGSIEDNKTGGWYSYRASKAALNMCIKNISIEFNRLGKECTVFAIHPGTTDTNLSAPFLKNARKKYTIHSAEETALNILKIVLNANNRSHNGKFFSWDGEEIPW